MKLMLPCAIHKIFHAPERGAAKIFRRASSDDRGIGMERLF